MELIDLLKRPEGKTLEFKRDISRPDGALKTIVASANTAGGTLLIGVEDKSGHVRGVVQALDLEEWLANLISDQVAPRLVPEIEILPWRRTHVLAVQVYPSSTRPHYVKREGPEAGVYVRVGSTNRRADRELIEELRRFSHGEAFDEQPMPGLDSEALDFRAASESFAAARAIEAAIGFVEKHAMHGAEIGAVRRKERWNLPPVAVREALINAVAHTDYAQRGAPIRVSIFEDRLEVENPGLLPFGLTIEDLHHGISKLRNRVIGRVFHTLGLIEQWGSGVQRMTAACMEMGPAPPRLEEIATRFRVTIFTERVGPPALDKTDQAIVGALAGRKGLLTSEIAGMIGLTPRATRTRLARLVGSGLVREVGTGPQDPKRRYFRAD